MEGSFKYILAKLVNNIIPKVSHQIFVEPHKNGKMEHQDIINYSGDSVLTFLNYLINADLMRKYQFILVIYNEDRVNSIKEYLNEIRIDNVTFLIHYSCFTGWLRLKHRIKYTLSKMRSKVCLCATVHDCKRYATNSQRLVCLEYFSSFKSDYNELPFNYLPKRWSLVCSTSVLDSATKSAAFAIPYYCFQPVGLARNDVLFLPRDKENIIREWISSKTGKSCSKIIIYAPTFRDYEENENRKRNVWGYENNYDITKAIVDNNAVVIAKMHSWQNMDAIFKDNSNVIFYEPSYNFTIYDVMAIADLMITDYSSIGLDFILIDKPVIYNLYDEELYMRTRGMCIEPIEEICGGEIVRDELSLADSIKRCLSPGYNYPDRQRVRNLFFKYQDGNSCERIYRYLVENEVL